MIGVGNGAEKGNLLASLFSSLLGLVFSRHFIPCSLNFLSGFLGAGILLIKHWFLVVRTLSFSFTLSLVK